MENKYKKHQLVKLLNDANSEFVEYHNEFEDEVKEIPIKKGMTGKINLILSNGEYHVEIDDKDGKIVAYVKMNEEDLEAID